MLPQWIFKAQLNSHLLKKSSTFKEFLRREPKPNHVFLQLLIKVYQETGKDLWYQWNQWKLIGNQHHNPYWKGKSKKEITLVCDHHLHSSQDGFQVSHSIQDGSCVSKATYTQGEKVCSLSQLNVSVEYCVPLIYMLTFPHCSLQIILIH